jgi:hypothetical protein
VRRCDARFQPCDDYKGLPSCIGSSEALFGPIEIRPFEAPKVRKFEPIKPERTVGSAEMSLDRQRVRR